MTRSKNRVLLVLTGIAFLNLAGPVTSFASGTTGDVLLIDSMQTTPAIQTPRHGMNMSDVRQQYGNPLSEGNPVGDPPITRWEYDGYSVFFEYDLVLHSVIHRPKQN